MTTQIDRWTRALAQLDRFLEMDCPLEARERARSVRDEIATALRTATADDSAKLRALKEVADAEFARCAAAYDTWTESVKARSDRYLSRERKQIGAE